MDYRNERDALRGRIETLEEELEDARRELAEARRREGEEQGSREEAARIARLEAAMPEAEALIQRLRGDLSAVTRLQEAHRPVVPEVVTEREAAPTREASEGGRNSARLVVSAIVAAILIAGIAIVGVVSVQRAGLKREKEEREKEVCAKARVCCEEDARLSFVRPEESVCQADLSALRCNADGPGSTCEKAAACLAQAKCASLDRESYCAFWMDMHPSCTPRTPQVPVVPVETPSAPTSSAQAEASVSPIKIVRSAPTPRVAKPHWSATVRRAEGLALAPGTLCSINATIEAIGTNSRVPDLEVACGGRTLYRKSDPFGGMASIDDDARELLGRRDDQSTFTLQFNDIGTRTGARSQVDFDSTKRSGAVFRETMPRWRVEFTMPIESEPTAPLSGSGQRLRREGRVTDASRGAIVSSGTACTLRAMPTGQQEACVAEVRCGATVLFPVGSKVMCTYDGARPIGLVSEGSEPILTLQGDTLGVTTGNGQSLRVVITLDPEKIDGSDAGPQE
jgi:hypothetical protein